MKIVLVNPPSASVRSPEEHLGLAYLKAMLVNERFEVEVIDAYLGGMSCQEVAERIIGDHSVGIVGVSPFIDSLNQSLDITRRIKQARSDIHVCWGGHLATFSAEELLIAHHEIDSIVRGEGERTLLELVKKIASNSNTSLQSIRGLAFRDHEKVVVTDERDLIDNLDHLCFPDRSTSQLAADQGALVQVSGSRGCYGNCSFCSINSLYRLSDGRTWRGRSPGSIVDELEQLHFSMGFDMFKFVDDSFFGPGSDWKDRALEIAAGIIRSNMQIRFRISTRVNNVDRRVFAALKEAGLYAVSVGVESGVQRMLDTFNKGTTVRQNLEALEVLKELGIITLMGFIGFDPYITLEEVKQNLAFLQGTLFAMTDLVSKPLYVHADDAITRRLIQEDMIRARTFPNFEYRMKDSRAEAVLQGLQRWNMFNRDLFQRVSDPLTAPRRTNKALEVKLLGLHRRLREIDLQVFDGLVKMVEIGYCKDSIRCWLEQQCAASQPAWGEIEAEFNALSLSP